MIQRIQSLYLVFAFLVSAASFFIEIDQAELYTFSLKTHMLPLGMVMGIIITCLLLALFMFKKRKTQIKLVRVSIIGLLFFMGLFAYQELYNSWNIIHSESINSVYFFIGNPFIAIIFSILALRHILKDEHLIKSLDRIR